MLLASLRGATEVELGPAGGEKAGKDPSGRYGRQNPQTVTQLPAPSSLVSKSEPEPGGPGLLTHRQVLDSSCWWSQKMSGYQI